MPEPDNWDYRLRRAMRLANPAVPSGDWLMAVGAIRKDTAVSLVNSDGLYGPWQMDNLGAVRVHQGDLDRTKDAVSVAQQTGILMNGAAELTPTFASISRTTAGEGITSVVNAVASLSILVLSWSMAASQAVGVQWQSSTINGSGGVLTNLSGVKSLGAGTPDNGAFSPAGHFITNVGEALHLNLGAAVTVGGHLTYVTK